MLGRSLLLRLCRSGQVGQRFYSSVFSKELYIEEHGKNPEDVLKFRVHEQTRKLQSNEVQLKLVGAPVNYADVNFVQGVYPIKSYVLPHAVGFEGSFEVEDCGSGVKNLKKGDLAFSPFNFVGTWQSRVVVDEKSVVKLPNVFSSPIDSATCNINPSTAYRLLHDFVSLSPGDVVVQNGATSHVGQAIIQLCKIYGVTSVNIIRDSDYAKNMKSDLTMLGASYVFTESEVEKKTLSELVGSESVGAKLSVNIVGGKSSIPLLKLLGFGGVCVTIGGLSRKPVSVSTKNLVFEDKALRGFWVTRWYENQSPNNEKYTQMLKDLMDFYGTNRLLPPLYTECVKLDDHKKLFLESQRTGPSLRKIIVPEE